MGRWKDERNEGSKQARHREPAEPAEKKGKRKDGWQFNVECKEESSDQSASNAGMKNTCKNPKH